MRRPTYSVIIFKHKHIVMCIKGMDKLLFRVCACAFVSMTSPPAASPLHDIPIIDLTEEKPIPDPIRTGSAPPSTSAPETGTRLQKLRCTICLDHPTQIAVTNCGHLFCNSCIRSALSNTVSRYPSCPVCRRRLNARQIYPLELRIE